MLSGDVHCSYLAEAELETVRTPRYCDPPADHVAVPEPIGLPIQLANKLLGSRWMTRLLHKLARSRESATWRRAGVRRTAVVRERCDDGHSCRRPLVVEVDHAALFSGRQVLQRTAERAG